MSESGPLDTATGRKQALGRFLPPFVLLAAIVGTIPVVRSLFVSDLNWCYPHLTPDSYDWINNGIYWAGAPVSPSFRPPGLPLLIGLLWKGGLLAWLPCLNFVALGATAFVLYRLLRERFSPTVAALSAWVFYANDFSQDLAKYVLAEVWATLFIVLAAWLFLRAANRPRLYSAFGLSLGIGFLFQYAAVPAGVGFAAAILIARREHLGRKELWSGAALSIVIPALWLAARAWHYRTHPAAPRHGVEALLHPSLGHLGFFAFAGTALLGLALLPLYAAGLFRMMAGDSVGVRDYRAAVLAPPAAMGIFFFFLYDWADKRFLFYLFPFAACLLAEGLASMIAFSRKGFLRLLGASTYLLIALLWNQIHYPSYGIDYLAITPRDFLDRAGLLRGAPVVRLHDRFLSAFSRGLFDFRLRPADCRLGEGYEALLRLRPILDERLGRGVPIGLYTPAGWPADYWSSVNRASNVLERPVVRPDLAPCGLAGVEVPGKKTILTVAPYVVVCRE
jgi:hypothetical protein